MGRKDLGVVVAFYRILRPLACKSTDIQLVSLLDRPLSPRWRRPQVRRGSDPDAHVGQTIQLGGGRLGGS